MTPSDCESILSISNGFTGVLMLIIALFMFSLGFFFGRSFLCPRSWVLEMLPRRHDELMADDHRPIQ